MHGSRYARGLVIVVLVFSTISLNLNSIDPAGAAPPANAFPPLARYELVNLDPVDLWAEVEDAMHANSTLQFRLGSYSWNLTLSPAPWETPEVDVCLDCGPGGSPLELPARSIGYYWGSIVDVEGSLAILTISETFAFGSFAAGDEQIEFEPAEVTGLGASGQVVVYSMDDVIGGSPHIHLANSGPAPLNVPLPPPQDTPMQPLNHGSRRVAFFADSSTWNDGTLRNQVSAVQNTVATNFYNQFGFSLPFSTYYCTTSTCDTTRGFIGGASAEDFYNAWSLAIKPAHNWNDAELAHGYSHKGALGTCAGLGYQPGRYSVALFGYLQGCDVTSVKALKVGHEIAHNFNGDHGAPGQAPNPPCPSDGSDPVGKQGRARCTAVWVSNMVYVCPEPWTSYYETTGSCPSGGYWDDQGGWEKRRSLMWSQGTWVGWVWTPSSGNHQYIEGCESGGWDSGTYEPTFVGDGGFVGYCSIYLN